MKPIVKFTLFWWALCCLVAIAYGINDGWTTYHIVGAILYAGLFVFEYWWERRRLQKAAGSKTWNQRVADGDI